MTKMFGEKYYQVEEGSDAENEKETQKLLQEKDGEDHEVEAVKELKQKVVEQATQHF